MNAAYYIGVASSDNELLVTVMDEINDDISRSVAFPSTAIGLQSLRQFLMCYMQSVKLTIAITGRKALELALSFNALKSTQVFIISEAFLDEPRALAKYAKHVA